MLLASQGAYCTSRSNRRSQPTRMHVQLVHAFSSVETKMNKSKVVISFTIVASILLIGVFVNMMASRMMASYSPFDPKAVSKLTKWSGATPQQMSKVVSIIQSSSSHKQMNDEDVHYLIDFVQKPKSTLPVMGTVIRSTIVFQPLSGAIRNHCLSDKQKEEAYQCAITHLSSDDKTGAEPIAAMTVLDALKDTRAVQYRTK